LPEGYTRPCWPIQTPGVGAHRTARREGEADAGASKRWDLLGALCYCPAASQAAWGLDTLLELV
jgi:hypothetical protein